MFDHWIIEKTAVLVKRLATGAASSAKISLFVCKDPGAESVVVVYVNMFVPALCDNVKGTETPSTVNIRLFVFTAVLWSSIRAVTGMYGDTPEPLFGGEKEVTIGV